MSADLDISDTLDVRGASALADLCEQQLSCALDGRLGELDDIAERLSVLARGLSPARVDDPAIRAQIVRALTALRVAAEVVRERLDDTAGALRDASHTAHAAAGYAASAKY